VYGNNRRLSSSLAAVEHGVVVRYTACALAGWYLIWLLGPVRPIVNSRSFPDSASYLRVADRSPFSVRFWFDERPPVYPLFLWLLHSSATTVVVVQSVLWVAAWVWLCSVAWNRIHSRYVSTVAIGLLIGVAVQARWGFWNTLMLTEGLSATLMIAMVAAWWQFVAEPGRFRAVAACSISACWMLIRDSNAVTLLVVVIPALVVTIAIHHRRPSEFRRLTRLALSVMLIAGLYSIVGQLSSNRGETSFHNNVGLRWLSDGEMNRFLLARGLPVNDALIARTGGDAWADGEAFLNSPELAQYRRWARGSGRSAAAIATVVKAPWWIDRLRTELPSYTSIDNEAYDVFDVTNRLPSRPLGLLDPIRSPAAIVVWTSISVVATGVGWRRRQALGLLLAFLLVGAMVDLYLSFVGDAVEVGRHLAGPLLRLSVAVIIAVGVGLDAAISQRTQTRVIDVAD
jgi:hypothetical protein